MGRHQAFVSAYVTAGIMIVGRAVPMSFVTA